MTCVRMESLHESVTRVRHVTLNVFCLGGWFARDPAILRKVGSVLLQQPAEPSFELKRWLVAKDAFSNCLEATEHAFYEVSCFFPWLARWTAT